MTHSSLSPGDRIDRYEVLELLGVGGMGEVYRARDERLERQVALKVLLPDLPDRRLGLDGSARLLREARAAAALSHPNVLAVFDVAEVSEPPRLRGLSYIAMELVSGASLRRYVGDRSVPITRRIAWLRDVARALAAAHEIGLVHRDVKPENVMVAFDGRVKVLDFGIARRADALEIARSEREPASGDVHALDTFQGAAAGQISPTQKGTGGLSGTPFYMAPEQLRGEPFDARADQFAWGVVAYELLVGEPPWRRGAEAEATRTDILTLDPKPPIERNATIPRAVSDAILRALAKEAADRFPRIAEVVPALESDRSTRRRRRVAIGAAGIGALAIVVAAMLRPVGPPVCEGAAREIGRSWGNAQRAAIERAFVATGNPRAQAMWGRVRTPLDAYAARWAEMWTESCRATRVLGVQSDDALDLRTACLDERARELSATADVLARADTQMVDKGVSLVGGLSDVARCADVASLRAPYSLPHEPERRKEVERIRGELARASVLVNARKWEEATPILSKVVDDARAANNRALVAGALYQQAFSAMKPAKTLELGFEAALEASMARDDFTEGQAWTQLIKTAGFDLLRFDESTTYARLAAAAIERAGNPIALKLQLVRNRAHALYGAGRMDESLALYREAASLAQSAFGPRSLHVAGADQDLADAAYGQGRNREALALYENTVAIQEDLLGPTSPLLSQALQNVSFMHEVLGDAAKAEAFAERALATADGDDVRTGAEKTLARALFSQGRIDEGRRQAENVVSADERLFGADAWEIGNDHMELSETLVRRHLLERAASEGGLAVGILARANYAAPTQRNARELLALALVRLGRTKDLLPQLESDLADDAKDNGDSSPMLLLPLLAFGELSLALHDAPRALTALERASTLAEAADGYPEWHADIHLALARALLMSHGDAARAKSLAERAAAEYDDTRLPDLATQARRLAASMVSAKP